MASKTLITEITLTIFLLVVIVFAFSASTLEGASRDRTGDGRRISTVPTVTPPPPPPTQTPTSSGGITSSTIGSVNTGDNEGGVVITGDEHVEVFEINIGPTNNTPDESDDEVEEPEEETEEQCGRRIGECTGETPERSSR